MCSANASTAATAATAAAASCAAITSVSVASKLAGTQGVDVYVNTQASYCDAQHNRLVQLSAACMPRTLRVSPLRRLCHTAHMLTLTQHLQARVSC
eukprot:20170-Heterococcus_DN1.PRE.1